MLAELVRGIIPENWHRYTVPKGCTVIQWITDFSQRVKQLQQISQVVSTSGAKELQVRILILLTNDLVKKSCSHKVIFSNVISAKVVYGKLGKYR